MYKKIGDCKTNLQLFITYLSVIILYYGAVYKKSRISKDAGLSSSDNLRSNKGGKNPFH